ncbi:TonB-dependent receptor [Arenibacter sp. ARW7G5Y1]|uniref:SusC/RagA family TonB-linked outer membrane protein n=1 Tax=Arenibacter sp. ARW7G5Y1 TaxID=2135619 RepID=UPI000D764E90|nr:TonB-dependent receptor [Arenibacter sp. ARW7G5Y1]PXX30390.1 TonB-linked SusC/RagA family outer membrane protein [Arenibacter sp. ARW7G5Y1]
MEKLQKCHVFDVTKFNLNFKLTFVLAVFSLCNGLAHPKIEEGIMENKLSKGITIHDDLFGNTKTQNIITGTVIDESGNPLAGASVVVKGTIQGVQTDFDGKFTLSYEGDATILVVSYIGYGTKEITVDNATELNIQLMPEASSLDEVVVVGYGTSKKSEITGSVGMITSEDIAQQPSVNPLQNLRGKIAGVTVFSNSGAPGGNNKVLIRGQGTINASTQPLYVVDGVQTDNIDYLNPSDIVSMEVLKDASSAAIYGARGANGVVLITTQGGLEGKGLIVEYKSNLSVGRLAKKRNSKYRAMNSSEFMDVQRIAVENAPYFRDYAPGEEPTLVLNNELLFDSNGNPLYDTNWEKEVTRTAFSQDHHISIRSGSENSSTGLFLNYTDQNGIILNSYLKRADMKLSYDVDLNDWLSTGLILRLNHVWENVPEVEGSGVAAISRAIHEFPSIFPIRWPDGTYSNSTQTQGTSLILEGAPNPVSVLNEVENLNNRTNINGNIFVDLKLSPELSFRSQFGLVNRGLKNRYYGPTNILTMGFPDGRASITNLNSTFWQNENFLTYDKEFESGNFKAMLGASWQEFTQDQNSSSVTGFKNNFFKYNNLGVAEITNPAQSDYTDWSMNSYFFRGNYTHNGKYTATITGRMDGSSRFGDNNKYAFFPSGGVSWFVSEEDFMSEVKAINMLRLRASYGVTGNTEIGSYNSLATISSGTNLIGGELRSTSEVTRLANPDLKWERSSQVNLGLNLRAFNDVLSVEADYYYKLTTDLLLDRPIPSTTGFTSITDNIGEVSNRGVDLLITTRNLETPNFSWNTSFSVNYNKNKVEALGENDEDIFPGPFWVGGSQTVLRVGEPVSSFWGQVRLGTYGTDEADEAAALGKLPGQIKRSDNQQIIGKGLPDYRGSLINKFSFGRFDAIVDMQFSYGADILQQFVTTAEDRQALTNGFKTQLYDSWTPNNQDTSVPIIRHTVISGQDLAVDSHWVADGSYLRANLISLGYNFNNNVLDALGLKHFRMNLSLENAFVIQSKDFKGYDPESNGQWDSSNFGQNIFFYSYPKARTLTMGLAVKF